MNTCRGKLSLKSKIAGNNKKQLCYSLYCLFIQIVIPTYRLGSKLKLEKNLKTDWNQLSLNLEKILF